MSNAIKDKWENRVMKRKVSTFREIKAMAALEGMSVYEYIDMVLCKWIEHSKGE